MTWNRGRNNICGIYEIRNIITNKVYIGSSADIPYRWNNVRSMLQRGKFRNIELQLDWDLYGMNNFEFSIIELINSDSRQERELREQFFIQSKTHCYNILAPGDGPQWQRTIE